MNHCLYIQKEASPKIKLSFSVSLSQSHMIVALAEYRVFVMVDHKPSPLTILLKIWNIPVIYFLHLLSHITFHNITHKYIHYTLPTLIFLSVICLFFSRVSPATTIFSHAFSTTSLVSQPVSAKSCLFTLSRSCSCS